MTFRTRVLLACLTVAIVPILLLGIGARTLVRDRMAAQYEARVAATTAAVREGIIERQLLLHNRLELLARRLENEPRLRAALLDAGDPAVLVGFAPDALAATGLDILFLLDGAGTVLSAGHYRLGFGTVLPGYVPLARQREPHAIAAVRLPAGEALALVRARAFELGGREFVLVAGVRVDRGTLVRLTGGADDDALITLAHPGGTLASADRRSAGGTDVTDRIVVPYVSADGELASDGAQWTIAWSMAPLAALLRTLDRWILLVLGVTVVLAFIAAQLVAARVTRPLEELARRAGRVEIARHDVGLATTRRDEIGSLSRLLDRMVQRLRAGAQQLREAERRATVGDMARQVNHDIRNGLLPIRNVVAHLGEVAESEPARLGEVFAERQDTLRSGIGYLESLATNYARLTPRTERQPCDVATVLNDALRDSAAGADPRVTLSTNGALPPVTADPVALRRVIENLTLNALEALPADGGNVTIRAAARDGAVVIEVADSGSGMTPDQVERIFDDFYTTRDRGTGLGLSIVRRLVADMGGRIAVRSEPGRGTTFTIELPAAS